MNGRTHEQWREAILAHLREFPRSWFTSYDLGGKLAQTSRERGGSHGRSSHKIKQLCEQLCEEGLLDRREERDFSTPYSKTCKTYYRITLEGACVPAGAPVADT